jgi:hypothetical protein
VPHPFRFFLRKGWDTNEIWVYTISENALALCLFPPPVQPCPSDSPASLGQPSKCAFPQPVRLHPPKTMNHSAPFLKSRWDARWCVFTSWDGVRRNRRSASERRTRVSVRGEQAAPFVQQMDRFSCRYAHGFNRRSTRQVVAVVGRSGFALVTGGFSYSFSPPVPSSHELPRLVLFEFIEGNSSGFPMNVMMSCGFVAAKLENRCSRCSNRFYPGLTP